MRILSAAVMFDPRSETKWRALGLRATNLQIARMSELASCFMTISAWTDRVDMHVNTTTHTFHDARLFIFTPTGPKRSSPVHSYGGRGVTRKDGSVAIFCVMGFLKAFWQDMHFLMTLVTSWRPWMIHTLCLDELRTCLAPA